MGRSGTGPEIQKEKPALRAFQKAKMERNRQKALLLRQARLQAHPYRNADSAETQSVIRSAGSRLIDTGGGFLIEQDELDEQASRSVTVSADPAPIIEPDRPHCLECDNPMADSYLYRWFLHAVCDTCRDDADKHQLVTRTDARYDFLLKDCDIDKRPPPLKFVLRKNPHNPQWGDMKLYLLLQVKQRAVEVWGSLEAVEEQRVLRDQKREKAKVTKFNREVKALRMAVRSSVYRKRETEVHQHDLDDERHDADEDVYYRTCRTCGYRQTYEKM